MANKNAIKEPKIDSTLLSEQSDAGENLHPSDVADGVKKVLNKLLLVLKILTAITMFLLGLLDEGRKLVPIPDVDPVEVGTDSLALSSLGMVVNVGVGCPIMEYLGELASELLKYL